MVCNHREDLLGCKGPHPLRNDGHVRVGVSISVPYAVPRTQCPTKPTNTIPNSSSSIVTHSPHFRTTKKPSEFAELFSCDLLLRFCVHCMEILSVYLFSFWNTMCLTPADVHWMRGHVYYILIKLVIKLPPEPVLHATFKILSAHAKYTWDFLFHTLSIGTSAIRMMGTLSLLMLRFDLSSVCYQFSSGDRYFVLLPSLNPIEALGTLSTHSNGKLSLQFLI